MAENEKQQQGPRLVNQSDTATGQGASDANQQQPPQGTQRRIMLDDRGITTQYANFFAVSMGTDEVFLTFGNQFGDATRVRLESRVVLSPANTKRMLMALSQVVRMYEERHGVIDITPRQPQPAPGPQNQGGTTN